MAVTTTKRLSRRSAALNRYYWKVVIPAWSDYTGYDKREMHDTLALHFLPDVDRDGCMTRERTSTLPHDRFAHYVDDCRRLLAQEGIYIPDPNEDRHD